jgi:hypothetical protein
MAHNHNNGMSGVWNSLNSLNLIVAFALASFSVFALVQVELMSPLIDFVEDNPQLPLAGSLGSIILLVISGNTRDPQYYHPVEMGLIGAGVVLMVAMSFFDSVRDPIINNNPHAGAAVVLIMLVVAAVIGR